VNLLLAAGIAVSVLCIFEGLFLFLRGRFDPETKRIDNQLKEISKMRRTETSLLLEGRALSKVPWLNSILIRIPLARRLDTLLVQSGLTQPLGVYVLVAVIFSLTGFTLLLILTKGLILPIVGLCLGILPIWYIVFRKKQRIRKFEDQLPDALDLMARSLRAGHALNGGLQMVADEFLEPIGPEFAKTAAQISFGVGIEQALQNMTSRIDCQDLKFLAVSIIIQRETGGNLAEILESIAHLIRERGKLRGKVKALSAEGKLSAAILVGLPFVVLAALLLINPSYIGLLIEDTLGIIIITAAASLMAVGILAIKKIVAIEV
jgi:tight adherence protein B